MDHLPSIATDLASGGVRPWEQLIEEAERYLRASRWTSTLRAYGPKSDLTNRHPVDQRGHGDALETYAGRRVPLLSLQMDRCLPDVARSLGAILRSGVPLSRPTLTEVLQGLRTRSPQIPCPTMRLEASRVSLATE